ncbi:MAG: protein kinase [Myxococcales bacterium]|nr:protein kinase [Myxococcales bacterium]
MDEVTELPAARRIGRYLLYGPIASGGMATVHYGALLGEGGFSRTVAIKRLHGRRSDRSQVKALLDEARLVSRIQHPNVVPTLDVISDDDGEVLVVLDYVVGESLSRLASAARKRGEPVPIDFATTIIAGVLHGLHAAHEAKTARGKALGIVHRDVSPQNIMVGVDGLARVLDFGIAKATERLSKSIVGQIKGKLSYMPPEQLRGQTDRRTDVYSVAVVLWELLTGQRLFAGETNGEVFHNVLEMEVAAPSRLREGVAPELDALVLRGLDRDPSVRFATAEAFALALEELMGLSRASQIGAWVQRLCGDRLARRAEQVTRVERDAATRSGSLSTLLEDGPRTEEVHSDAALGGLPEAPPTDTEAPLEVASIAAGPEVAPSGERPLTPSPGASAPRPAGAEGRSRQTFVWAAAGVLGILLAVVYFARKPAAEVEPEIATSPPEVGTTEVAAERMTSPEPSGVPSTPTASAEPVEAPPSIPASAPRPTTVPVPWPRPPGPSTPASAAPPVPAPVPAPPPSPSAAAPNCNPPYRIDASGVRRLKPECL